MLVGHVEVDADSGTGHVSASLGAGFRIEFDVSYEPEWEEDCALEGFLVSRSPLSIHGRAANIKLPLFFPANASDCPAWGGVGHPLVSTPGALPVLLELPRGGDAEQGRLVCVTVGRVNV